MSSILSFIFLVAHFHFGGHHAWWEYLVASIIIILLHRAVFWPTWRMIRLNGGNRSEPFHVNDNVFYINNPFVKRRIIPIPEIYCIELDYRRAYNCSYYWKCCVYLKKGNPISFEIPDKYDNVWYVSELRKQCNKVRFTAEGKKK